MKSIIANLLTKLQWEILSFVNLRISFEKDGFETVNFKVIFVLKQERKIIFHGKYFVEFYIKQTAKVQEKIEFVFRVIRTVDNIPEKFLKHLTGTNGLYEIRIELGNNIFRIFCCFDKNNLVILFNAFQKKMQKTPKQELDLALKLKKEYFQLKENENEKTDFKKR